MGKIDEKEEEKKKYWRLKENQTERKEIKERSNLPKKLEKQEEEKIKH